MLDFFKKNIGEPATLLDYAIALPAMEGLQLQSGIPYKTGSDHSDEFLNLTIEKLINKIV